MTARAMVVLSGGQDSTTALYWAKQRFDEVHAVTFDYGQRHRREIESAKQIAAMVGIASHELVHASHLRGRSPLTDPGAQLETYQSFEQMDKVIGERVELTFVPMRNQLFLTLAANRAVCLDIYDLVTGVCEADNANYPDCRRRFIDAMELATGLALGVERFCIHTPLIHLSKAQSIALAQSLPGAMEALAYTHTCYAGESPPCGKCHACVLRAEGFRQAGVADPLLLAVA